MGVAQPDSSFPAAQLASAGPMEEDGAARQAGASPGEEQMRAWRESPQWSEHTPRVEVSNPKGTFCVLDCATVVGLPPDAVFDILCDTGNQRVFKNVKGVRNRRVIEEDEKRSVVELEMVSGWRFLIFSGEFGVLVRITQDRPNMKVSFELAKPGFMRLFKGAWTVQPFVPASVEGAFPSKAGQPGDLQVASEVRLVQEVQPALNPPPILAQYLRHIAAHTMHGALQDLQLEAARIRYGLPESCDVKAEVSRRDQEMLRLRGSFKIQPE